MANLSRRAFLGLSTAFVAQLAFPHVALAHGKDEHFKELERVILGETNYKTRHRNDTAGIGIRAIENASYLCIDQFQGNGTSEYEWLHDHGFWVPEELKKIDYSASGKTHRAYTHCGWDMTYKDDRAHWDDRKKLLLNTVEKVFDFRVLPSWLVSYDERCNSFAALVYYVHILGDFLEDDTMGKFEGETNGAKVAFARSFPTDTKPDIFWELDKHIGILLLDQNTSWTYQAFMIDLKDLARRARKIARQRGDVEDSKFDDVHACAEELMALLSGYSNPDYSDTYTYKSRLHSMLAKETYFNEVFPSS